ncbi:pre T-cell antigen receptor alpha isoform X1 [Pipra filicauda]|uniref:pre T-cell antigen receptor alpha isoform X1 n=1 Tax=Pipra filicauda TaxID=649802 RepID=UPI0019395038|nr:pre T-cell antigen receptor alpha isoform X1 [Pipra filicauda]
MFCFALLSYMCLNPRRRRHKVLLHEATALTASNHGCPVSRVLGVFGVAKPSICLGVATQCWGWVFFFLVCLSLAEAEESRGLSSLAPTLNHAGIHVQRGHHGAGAHPAPLSARQPLPHCQPALSQAPSVPLHPPAARQSWSRVLRGNGSVLPSFAYGASQEDGGTVCSVSLLSNDLLAEGELACHVGANRTSPSHSSSPIRITGMTLLPPLLPCPLLPNLLDAPVAPEEGGGRVSGSRCEALWANVTASTGRHRKGFVASPAAHLVLGCQCLPSCSFIPQATRRWQSCVLVAQLVSLWPYRGGNVSYQGENPAGLLAGA